ncbi:hypothetical protein CC31p239 [Enterobacter phage CC31]|uniref:Uncharacterized protein n=1 Tax=Enterobacter phage CC31 TaxID=709484 RepID=E5DHX1_9CAUD|nr:hypothetical protein CC31p239 [Enterobacter phage CC31]ADB81735.1 hypothetical protein CC31p239 [Enterobacter phage CC31]
MNGYNLRLLETYKTQKKWKNWNKVHGVYELSFAVGDIREYRNGEYTIYDGTGNNPIELCRSMKSVLLASMNGNVSFSNGCVTMIGDFFKSGSQVFFNPLEEQYENQ